MEKDIEILEKLLEKYDEPCGMHINPTELWQDERDAIENLINRVKELEDEVEKQKETIKKYENYTKLRSVVDFYKKNSKNDFIPKSKIKEKIEEYNKMIKATYGDITHQGDIRRDNCKEIRNVLQELLEEQEDK